MFRSHRAGRGGPSRKYPQFGCELEASVPPQTRSNWPKVDEASPRRQRMSGEE
jgi:hypothetical protein